MDERRKGSDATIVSHPVSPEYLLEGAVRALEQCGLLLRDANILYRNGSYASAVALAAFAREELGRWKILLGLRERVVGGETLTIEKVQAQCDDHVSKQRAGMLSTTMRADQNSGLGKLLSSRFNVPPGSAQRKAIDRQIKKLDRQLGRRVPDDRHKQRMSALYVDADSSGGWTRPSKDITQPIARDVLQDAANDYSLQYSQRYTDLEIVKHVDPELFKELTQWSDRPELPHPEWPNWLGEKEKAHEARGQSARWYLKWTFRTAVIIGIIGVAATLLWR